MKKVKKILSLMLVAALTLVLASCGSGGQSQSAPAPTASESAESAAESAAPAGEKLKLVVCVGWINDLSFYQSTYEGSQKVLAELGDKYEVEVVEMGTDNAVWPDAFYDAADNGADIIVSVGYQNKEAFETIPKEYPDTKFILFDQELDFSAGGLDNVLSIVFDANEAGFLSGAAAGYYTTSEQGNPDKKIGFVGAYDSATINNFLVGYAEGARYVDPEIEVSTAYIGGFSDTAKAKDLAKAQIAGGADVMFQVAGGAGNGVFEAVTENGGVAIGVDSDQFVTLKGTGLEGSIMTSCLKEVGNALFKLCSDYAADPASVAFGENVVYGLGENAVGIVYNENLTKYIGEENVTKIKELQDKIAKGEIKVTSAIGLSADEIKKVVAGK
ncbi:BMP family ABC transporter substrate-binding protein [Oscillospiraceae bacterium MB08-C2-2]|nr:BMP family ABC transporter substrate-binding protein [Oscillospiraceae bacterium MB08-C2-2]